MYSVQATLRQQGLRCQRLTARHIAQAALSLPQTTDIQKLSDEDRTELAHRLGYRQIGKELPDDVTLGQIIKSMPQEVRMLFIGTAKHLDRAQPCTGHMSLWPKRVLLCSGLAQAAALGRAHCLQSQRPLPVCWGQSCNSAPVKGCSSPCSAAVSAQLPKSCSPAMSMALCCLYLTPSSQRLMPCLLCMHSCQVLKPGHHCMAQCSVHLTPSVT